MSHTVHTNTYMYKKQVNGKKSTDKKQPKKNKTKNNLDID